MADGSGGHAFAETYDQHQRNVARWRQIEKTRATTDAPDSVDRVDPNGDAAVPAGTSGGLPQDLRGSADVARGGRQGRARGFDASEGTDKDPLKNKTFDLNSPKNVPVLSQP